jgi:hypothetical protein
LCSLGKTLKILVYVNNVPIELLVGMSVRHALIGAEFWTDKDHILALDQWGNEIGFDVSVHDGMYIKMYNRLHTSYRGCYV